MKDLLYSDERFGFTLKTFKTHPKRVYIYDENDNGIACFLDDGWGKISLLRYSVDDTIYRVDEDGKITDPP